MVFARSSTFFSMPVILVSSSTIKSLSWKDTFPPLMAFLLASIGLTRLHASWIVAGNSFITILAASLCLQPRRNDSVAICWRRPELASLQPSIVMAKIHCNYAFNVASSSCFARCKRCLAAMGFSLRSKRKANSCFSRSKLSLFSDLVAYSSALSVKQSYSRSNFFSSDHPFLLAIRSNLIIKDDQDKLVGSPENSWRRGGGGEWLLLELSPEVNLFERDFRCLDRPWSVFICPTVVSVCPVCAVCPVGCCPVKVVCSIGCSF